MLLNMEILITSHEAHVAQNNAVALGNRFAQGKLCETIHVNICKKLGVHLWFGYMKGETCLRVLLLWERTGLLETGKNSETTKNFLDDFTH